MNRTIAFTEPEEERLSAAAKQAGIAPEDLVKQLTLEHLPTQYSNVEDDLDVKLRRWQEDDGSPLMPDVPAETLYAQWAKEDALMTDQEREAEDRLWEELEVALIKNHGLHLRQAGS